MRGRKLVGRSVAELTAPSTERRAESADGSSLSGPGRHSIVFHEALDVHASRLLTSPLRAETARLFRSSIPQEVRSTTPLPPSQPPVSSSPSSSTARLTSLTIFASPTSTHPPPTPHQRPPRMLVVLLTSLLALPAFVAGAPTYITDPSSSGFLIQPEGNENGVRSSPGHWASLMPSCSAVFCLLALQCLTVAPGPNGVISNGNSVYLTQCARDFPSGVQGWEIARGAGSIKLKNTDWCLDAGVNPSNGVKMKVRSSL